MSSNIIIGIVGLALSILAIYLCFKSAQTRKNGDEVIATITKMHRGKEHTNVFVTYEYCGQIYQDVKLGYYRTGFYPGKEITIYVDPEYPDIPVAGGWLWGVIGAFIAIASIFALISG